MGGLFSKVSTGEIEAEKSPAPAAEEHQKAGTACQSCHIAEEKVDPSIAMTTEQKTEEGAESHGDKEEHEKAEEASEHHGDVSLLTEASRVPIPNSPCVDQPKIPQPFKGKGPLGPSPLSFEEKPSVNIETDVKHEDKNVEHEEKREQKEESHTENQISSVQSEDIKVDVKPEDKIDDSNSLGQIKDKEEIKDHVEMEIQPDKPKEMSPSKKDPMRMAECQLLDDSSVTMDVSVHQEMVLPVEELAEQFSNVVISTAARELQAEQRGAKQHVEGKMDKDDAHKEESLGKSKEGKDEIHSEHMDDMRHEGHKDEDMRHEGHKNEDLIENI